MRRSSIILIVVIFVLIGEVTSLLLLRRTGDAVLYQSPPPSPFVEIQKPVEEVVVQEHISEPQNIVIPRINVNAFIESVGIDENGRMEVPQGVFNVGWYSLGYKPGEKGNAVMAGHLDTVTGEPAVFYYINQLQAGDQVIVTDKQGRKLTFEVTGMQTYLFDQVPLQEIFGPSEKQRLNLITCTGVWNTGSRNYSSRLVVYTELRS